MDPGGETGRKDDSPLLSSFSLKPSAAGAEPDGLQPGQFVAAAGSAQTDRELVADEQQRLVKTGGRLVQHARYYWLLLAESLLNRGPGRCWAGSHCYRCQRDRERVVESASEIGLTRGWARSVARAAAKWDNFGDFGTDRKPIGARRIKSSQQRRSLRLERIMLPIFEVKKEIPDKGPQSGVQLGPGMWVQVGDVIAGRGNP